jgi:putative ABC transport system permease protein
MDWFRRRRRRAEEDLDDEIRFHLAEEARLRTEAGSSEAEAEASTRRDFGNVTLVTELTRAAWGRRALDDLGQDLRFAWRLLRRSPGFTIVAAGTLALAIGATTALFTVVNGVVLRPLAFPDPAGLVMVWESSPSGNRTNTVQPQNYLEWRARNRSFDAIALVQPVPINLVGPSGAEQVPGLLVTGEFFPVLGVRPLLGRAIRRGDDVDGAPLTVVLGYGVWQRWYGGSADVIGRKIAVNGNDCEVVGIMPRGFVLPGNPADVFAAYQIDPATAARRGRSGFTVARLRPTATVESAQTEMTAIAAQTERERPQTNARWGATVVPLREQAIGQVRPGLLVLFAAVVCVLLIACANIASLQIMRASARAREMTVRLALGAGRWRLVQQLLVESVLLAAVGGGLGLLLARSAVPAIVAMFPANFPLPRAEEIRVDRAALVWTAAVSLGAGVFFGLLPGLQAGRRAITDALRGGGRVAAAGRRVRTVLVVSEVTLAVVLVVAAGLLIRSLGRLYDVDPGFRPEGVLALRMLVVPTKYPEPERRAALIQEMLERVRRLPGVTSAGAIHFLPLSGPNSGTGYRRMDRPEPAPGQGESVAVSVVTPGYFRTMGIPLRAGRDLEEGDGLRTRRVAVVNEALVRRAFPGEDPLGKRLFVSWGFSLGRQVEPVFEIVGVAGDVRHEGLNMDPQPTVFLSYAQEPGFMASLVVRAAGDPLALASPVRQEMARVDPDQGVLSVGTLQALLDDSIARPRLQAVLVGGFAALALLIACVGLYGVLAYSVEQRQREMGVRVAIGASPRALLGLVVGEGVRLTAAGLVLGLAGAFVAARSLASLLYGIGPTDPVVFLAVAAILLMVAAAASFVPARQAMRVDPITILRDE